MNLLARSRITLQVVRTVDSLGSSIEDTYSGVMLKLLVARFLSVKVHLFLILLFI